MLLMVYVSSGDVYNGLFILDISQAVHLRFLHLLLCIFQYKVYLENAYLTDSGSHKTTESNGILDFGVTGECLTHP